MNTSSSSDPMLLALRKVRENIAVLEQEPVLLSDEETYQILDENVAVLLAATPSTMEGAVAALDWVRGEFAEEYAEGNSRDRCVLALLDGALAVVRMSTGKAARRRRVLALIEQLDPLDVSAALDAVLRLERSAQAAAQKE